MKDAVVAVSTVKADPDQVERFLRRNLGAGVDHIMVFLDDPKSPARKLLEEHPHVTVVRTGPRYWNGTRPPRVSDRLRINMNLANAVLATVPSVAWLISIDSDEAVCIDRDALVRSEQRAVLLSVLEAVSKRSWPDDEPTLFKSRPTDGELAALAAMGVILEPDLAFYFRGHQEGKTAARPDLKVRMRVHSAVNEAGRGLARPAPGMHVLHYESHSLDDFIRRWKDYAPASAHLRTHRDERKLLGIALHTLHNHEVLSERERNRLIKHLFDREVADDAKTLQKMGLAGPAPKREYEPRPLPPADLDHLERLLEGLLPGDKHVFNEGGTAEQIAAELAAAADRMAGSGADAAVENVRRTLDEFHHRSERPPS
ncbi:glycosyltransferase family 2 protein [Nocardioides sp.]|uniref:glycosyltransferase family 2 protein n=1 Tax=Nocardioides sp. TaxID=35761 RepID=UPI002D807BD3|nr:glycosyltransferase family 2 protein [Nocardioides sp.]HET8961654.1 glycosyltransferase family 2 protein [Nocardioides sp.]